MRSNEIPGVSNAADDRQVGADRPGPLDVWIRVAKATATSEAGMVPLPLRRRSLARAPNCESLINLGQGLARPRRLARARLSAMNLSALSIVLSGRLSDHSSLPKGFSSLGPGRRDAHGQLDKPACRGQPYIDPVLLGLRLASWGALR